MFYSQTFLARKGPLGTVWCAAHLQHRLKKSHYTSTDISSTVDRIMFPEVPIALRMSGHLLLGVVRIYSKKVDYLHHDSNVVLISLSKAFSNIDLNLPEDAAQAPVHSVTLPERFDLDALELDDYMYDDGHDHHLRSREDITLTDQIPTGEDVYVAITFDEGIMMGSSMHQEEIPSGISPIEEEYLPSILRAPPLDVDMVFQGVGPDETEVLNENVDIQDPGASNQREVPGPSKQTEVLNATMDPQDPGAANQREVATDTVGHQDPGASNQTEEQAAAVDFPEPGPSSHTEVLNMGLTGDSSPQSVPEVEVRRDAVDDISPGNIPPLCSDHGNVASEPINQVFFNEKEIHTPILEDVFPSGGQSFEFQPEAPPSAVSQEVSDMCVSFENASQLAIKSTPPLRQQKPRRRKRKFFDESIVLSNALIKKGLEGASDLVRKRRNMPNSALGLWKFNNSLRKEQVFQEPSITGLSADICNIFKKDYISSKPHLAVLEEVNTEPMIVGQPTPETAAVLDDRILQSPIHATENIAESPNRIAENIAESPSCMTKNNAESSSQTAKNVAGSPSHTNEVIPERAVAESSSTVPEFDMEIEQLTYNANNIRHYNVPEFMSLPFRRDDMTPLSTNIFEPESVPWTGTTVATDILPTPDIGTFTGSHSEFETPRTLLTDQQGHEYSGLSDIPELANSVEAAELDFLEADNSTPGSHANSNASQGVDLLSVRSRAVAQYLKRQSPICQLSEDPPGHLSLNNILAGKTRKLCARMFFETLVLKSHGLIDVQQEQPYGDITLRLTRKLSKADI